MKKTTIRRLVTAALVLTALIASYLTWRALPVRYEMYDTETISFVRGVVTQVNRDETEESADMPGWRLGVQNITVRLTGGEDAGTEVTFDNYLSTTHAVVASAGLRVIVKADQPEGVAPYYSLYQYDRSGGLALAALLFVGLMALAGRGKGLCGALGLALAICLIGGVLLPSIYNGLPPVGMTLLVCMVIAALSLLLLNGVSRKTGAAVLSTALGMLGAAAFYALLSGLLHVTGYHLEEGEELILIARSTGLQIRQILFSGILLSSLGAVMDTAMSVASSLWELRQVHPNIRRRELFRSGMTIGGDMIGTMCQTLVLAFAGGALATLLVLLSYGTQPDQFLSSDLVALEVLQSLTGSLAVVLAVPVTSAVCALLLNTEQAETAPRQTRRRTAK
jgi:uncharacterized membrane protein